MSEKYREFHISVEHRSGKSVSCLRSDLEPGPVYLGTHEVRLDRGTVVCDGTRLVDGQWVEVTPGQSCRLTVREKFTRAEETEPRLKRRYCMNCQHWDRAEGVRQFAEQTHRYANGSLSRVEEIIRAVTTHNKLRPLTPTNLGYCPLFSKLCAETSPACVEHYSKKPWLARVRNWWLRMFR